MNGVVQINNGTVENCYYLADSETDNGNGIIAKTTEQFASGEVCYLLNGDQSAIAFYQDLSAEKYPTLNADSEQVYRLEMTYDESFGEDTATVTTYHNTGTMITLEKSPDNAYTYHYYVGETEITESPYTLTADTEIIVKKVPVEIQLSEGIGDTIELTYHKKMDALDLNDFVTNLDVLESVDFQVDAASALPEDLTLTAAGALSGTPEKAADEVKTTLILTAKNGATKKAELTFHIAKADPTVEVTVDGDKHTEGDPVDELGLILSDNSTKGTVKIVGEIKRLAAGKNTLTWEFTPVDSDNYNVVTGTVIVNAQATTTTTVTTTKATAVTTNGTKASTTTNGTTSATKASAATSGTTSTTKASTVTSGTTSTTKASVTTSRTTSATTTAITSATATTTTTVTTSATTASATTTSTTTTSATSTTTNTITTTTTETRTSTSTSSSDTPEGQISVTISTESVYCTAEDSAPFDLASFMSISLVNAAGETVDVTADVTLEYDSPAALFAARNTAYIAENLKAIYTAENGEVYEITGPMVCIGKKGDANLDGKVDSTDIYELMRYIADIGAGFSDTKLLETSPDAADENLSVLAYFLADADTESTEGKNTAEKRLDPQDMFYVMYYVANRGAGVPVTWSDIIR